MEINFAFAAGHFDPVEFALLMDDLATVAIRLDPQEEPVYTLQYRKIGSVRVTLKLSEKIHSNIFTKFGYDQRLEDLDAVFSKM